SFLRIHHPPPLPTLFPYTTLFRSRVAPPERIPKKRERILRQMTPPRLLLVHRQPQLAHHVPHRGHRVIRVAPTTNHEVICIVDEDRKSTRLNSSHVSISYAVFCLK